MNFPCDMIYALRAKILTTTQAQLAFHALDIKAIECCGQRGRISRTKVHFTLRQQHFTIIMTELISVNAPQGCGGDVPCGICVFMQKGIAPTRNSIIIKIFLRQKGGHSNASLSRTVDII